MDGMRPQRKPTTPKPLAAQPAEPRDLPAPSPLNLSVPPIPKMAMPRKKQRLWLWIAGIAASFIILAIIGVFSAFAWYADALKPLSADSTTITVKVEDGATIDQVAQELQQKKVIKSSLAFSLYMKVNNKAVIKTGTYFFAPNQSVSEIVGWLNDGRVGTRKVTILPGKTLKQLRQSFIDDGFSAEAVDAAFAKHYDHPLLAEKPASATLEGYIFPETYFVESGSTPDQLIERTFDEFEKRIEENNIRAKLQAHGFSLYQGITLASIITRETTHPDDQRQVAQVFELRLQNGMMLGSDVTYHYAADLLGVEPASTIDSPYNTRIHTGLPPGPIANFNLSALLAVTEPAAGDYLYFVAGDDGTTHFARTFEEHQRNIDQYCKKLCAQS